MQIKSNTFTMHLKEMPLDIGYASEKVSLFDTASKKHVIGGQNGKTQLIITTPVIDDTFLDEVKKLDEIVPTQAEHEVEAFLVVANDAHKDPELSNINFYIDMEEELSDFYGVGLSGEPYNDELTKAVILISKDGAIFYDEFLSDLDGKFNIDTLQRKIMAAQQCYTGKGCH